MLTFRCDISRKPVSGPRGDGSPDFVLLAQNSGGQITHVWSCFWCSGDAGREAGGFRVLGQKAEGVGPGQQRSHRGIPSRCARASCYALVDEQRIVADDRGGHAYILLAKGFQ
jgi:hypothetical protein